MSTAIKTSLHGSSNSCTFESLKNHINTCLLRWRQKRINKSDEHRNEHHQITSQEETCYCHYEQCPISLCDKYTSKEYSFIHLTAVSSKSFSEKIQNFITPQQLTNNSNSKTFKESKSPRIYGRKVEIVSKLLSSNLVSKANSSLISSKSGSPTSSAADIYKDNMTITDLFDLREEYPYINSEIRSILTARAQEGATIPQISDDYRKLTGLPFPIYENVTDFLLSIPHVTAYCNDKGMRIFNIRPIDKTKHIHDMVMQQKSQPEPTQRPTSHNYYRERFRGSNYQPSNWRQNTSHLVIQNNKQLTVEPVNSKQPEQRKHVIPSSDSNLPRDGSIGRLENNYFYKDNCNYLFNRICNQQQQEHAPSQFIENTPQITSEQILMQPSYNPKSNTAWNKLNTDMSNYKNNIKQFNNLFQIEQPQQLQCQQNLNNLRNLDGRHSSLVPHKVIAPVSSRSSSPAAKSCYTDGSAFTDSEYEAHLLDFLLLGDDFLLYLARMELRCKFKKNQRVLQSGLCVSGQTIAAAIKRIKMLDDRPRSIIVNIGSVDIMQGRQLIQIEHDFRELFLVMLKKNIKPILTTLAPLANYSHNNEVKRRLERFNEFIKREAQQRKLIVIDIWRCLVNEKGHVHFDCYQSEPRNVTGAAEPYLFWNKIGRQRVLQLIESKLEY